MDTSMAMPPGAPWRGVGEGPWHTHGTERHKNLRSMTTASHSPEARKHPDLLRFSAVVCCGDLHSTGLENRRPFTRSKGSNPFPSAILVRSTICHSVSLVRS